MEADRSAVEPVADRVLVTTTDLPLPPAAAFGLFADSAALAGWLCKAATVEPRLGGRYELFWDPAAPEDNSTIGCRITAYEPDRLLAFQWRSPAQFKHFANRADPLTHVVVSFHVRDGGTTVTLVHSGWRSAPQWQEAAQWQASAWRMAFKALAARAQAVAGAAEPFPFPSSLATAAGTSTLDIQISRPP